MEKEFVRISKNFYLRKDLVKFLPLIDVNVDDIEKIFVREKDEYLPCGGKIFERNEK